MLRGAATSFGYKTVEGNLLIYCVPLAAGAFGVAASNTVIAMTGQPFGAIMFPIVAAAAHRICVRSGLLTVLVCALGYNFFCAPPSNAFSIPSGREIIFYLSLAATALVVAPKYSGDPQERRVHDRSADLPFTRRKGPDRSGKTVHKKRVFWDVKPTGNWAYDCQTGEEYARLFMERQASREPRPALCWVIGDMVAAGNFGATEIGFIQGLVKAHVPRKPKSSASSS